MKPSAARSALFAAAMLAGFAPAAAQPASPAPGAANFPTIGRTRSQRYCAVETERTNGAIVVALTNDRIIASGIAKLRSANLDRPELTTIEREKSLRDLRAVAAAIQHNLQAGDAQTGDLRALSVKEPDATRSAELKLLADELDGAYGVQRSVGADLAKMLTIVDGRRAAAQGTAEAAAVVPEAQEDHVRNGLPPIDQRASYEPLDTLFADVADEFSGRAIEIGKDEDAAALHAPKAVTGC